MSNVREMREQIELQAQALNYWKHAPRAIGGHDRINAAYENIGKCVDQLVPQIGAENAMELVKKVLDKVIE